MEDWISAKSVQLDVVGLSAPLLHYWKESLEEKLVGIIIIQELFPVYFGTDSFGSTAGLLI